jgi:hypothetical protein
MDYREPWTELAPRAEVVVTPALDWRAAQARGEALIATAAERRHFTVEWPIGLRLNRERGVYQNIVCSSLDFGDKRGRTRVYFNADTMLTTSSPIGWARYMKPTSLACRIASS